MKRFLRSLVVATGAVVALSAGAAGAAVTVTFTQPESYADMPFANWDKEQVMKDLQNHFDKMGAKLPQGQDLKVEVLDIDLAGRLDFARSSMRDIRILKGGADWPAMKLRYSIESQGKVLKSGEARVADMTYLSHFNRYPANEPLRYEKKMLDDWFEKVTAEAP